MKEEGEQEEASPFSYVSSFEYYRKAHADRPESAVVDDGRRRQEASILEVH